MSCVICEFSLLNTHWQGVPCTFLQPLFIICDSTFTIVNCAESKLLCIILYTNIWFFYLTDPWNKCRYFFVTNMDYGVSAQALCCMMLNMSYFKEKEIGWFIFKYISLFFKNRINRIALIILIYILTSVHTQKNILQLVLLHFWLKCFIYSTWCFDGGCWRLCFSRSIQLFSSVLGVSAPLHLLCFFLPLDFTWMGEQMLLSCQIMCWIHNWIVHFVKVVLEYFVELEFHF